ncbi:D-alanine--D-alanine ligase family protein [Cryptosporangium sp. NPDC051539]|uniref:D-alanine--D-alanine ligase family protein n=1 Tax=Cryptosporangium sp. NPDC051539 TaxID=3363962 RepID=UPI00378789A7
MTSKLRVAVVFGGRSTEHAISCISGGAVLAGLDRDQFDVIPVGITPEGRWVLAPDDPAALRASGRELPGVKDGTEVILPGDPTRGGLIVAEPARGGEMLAGVDVVFPVLHGPYGEDGTIQGLLEMAGLPYVGSGVFASAAAMDKEFTKKLLAAEGLAVGDYVVLHDGGTLSDAQKDHLGLPVFVKPARGGSSIGITRVTDWSQLGAALVMARAVDPKVLVEAAVVGREVECGVLEGEHGGPPEASLPAEIRIVSPDHDWYDFEAKYLDDACEFDIPAGLPPEVTVALREAAGRAFSALGCAGLARVDFFVTPDGGLVVNEVNTMPGFTPISMFPRMWAETGLPFDQLVGRLVRTAVARGSGLR